MATIKQLAIALNTDLESLKIQFINQAQESDNFEFADQVKAWKADDEIPPELEQLALKHGLNLTRKRKPAKGVNGGLANPSQVVQAFMQQLPDLIANSIIDEQQAFLNESRYAGKMTGLAGSLAFQQELLSGFSQGNQAFRQARQAGIGRLKDSLSEEFNNLYTNLCDNQRQLTQTNESIIYQRQELDAELEEMNKLLGKQTTNQQ